MTDPDVDAPADGEPGPRRSSSALTRKVGPLTVQAWLIVIGVGGALGLVIRRFGSSSSSAPQLLTEPSTDSGSGAPSGGWTAAGPNAGAAPGSGIGTPPDPRTSNPYTAATNMEWQRIATERLVAAGYGLDPLSVSNALTRYLQGDPLDPAQAAIVTQALRAAGTPPEYVPAIVLAPSTAPAPAGPPTGTPTPSAAPATPPGQTNIDPAFGGWLTGYDAAKKAFLAGANATELFPRMVALGITSGDPNLKPNPIGVGWYRVYLKTVNRLDLDTAGAANPIGPNPKSWKNPFGK